MSGSKDYYQILGVNKTSTPEEIKQAYRKLAREHHPDMVKDTDKDAAEKRFKEINEAYQVLSDPQKRKMYDQFGSAGPGFGGGGFDGAGQQSGQWGPFTYSYSSGGNPFGGQQGFGDFDPFDVFESFFGSRGFGGKPRKGKNLYYEMPISFSDAVFGIERDVDVESGKVKIKIPAGVRDGTEIRFTGKGMSGPAGVPSGDLYISVRVSYPREFEVSEDNIFVTMDIDFVTATLGGEVELPVVDLTKKTGIGSTVMKIPAGTQSGSKFLIRGKGMPRLSGKGQGDALLQVFVSIPKKVSKRQRDLLEEFKRS